MISLWLYLLSRVFNRVDSSFYLEQLNDSSLSVYVGETGKREDEDDG